MPAPEPSTDVPPPLGAHPDADGTQFCVYAGAAEAVHLCVFDADGGERTLEMVDHAHGRWSRYVPGVGPGTRYGYRVQGPWEPAAGHRHNPAKLLLDPYARGIEGEVSYVPEVFGHQVDENFSGDGSAPDERDSAPFVPRSVVLDSRFDWGADAPPRTSWRHTVLYEAHVVNLTQTLPEVPEHLRGTYAGVAHPATLAHLHRLGVTAIELLPVHAFTHEPHLVKRGLVNHWGYNTLGFLAPHAAYACADAPQEVVDEFKGMVKLLHAAGIEVILDVVYNHTAEQGAGSGATFSWRGLDAAAYYRLDGRGHDVDVTGCGNTLNTRNPVAMALVLDSLRYWVEEMHVDGFRFDLAPALARGRDDGYDVDHPFLMALRADPVLSRVKLIAEPWDVGPHGWRTGQFPPPFAEWNDVFRDAVRTFWLVDLGRDAAGEARHGIRDLGTRLAGSSDLFTGDRRGPLASINMVTAHDGFTAADLTRYNSKHNEANGEDNRDGSGENRSFNHGVEGLEGVDAGGDAPVAVLRRRSLRNLLATTILSSGVPMLLGGDEFGRTQQGNNNPYCQNNEISWYDWDLEPWQDNLIETTAALTALRRAHRVLHPRQFFPLEPVAGDGRAALGWFAPDGSEMTPALWDEADPTTLIVVFDGSEVDDDRLLLILHGGAHEREITLPRTPGVGQWRLLWDSVAERPDLVPELQIAAGAPQKLAASSFTVLRGEPA
ncbi:glycogen debranching protein GlgX [Dermacoccaceae bacterium W4C1]